MAASISTQLPGRRSDGFVSGMDVVTFGEAMIRLSPPGHQRLEQVTSLDVAVGGAELSVAAGIARLGLKAAWVSRLPNNPLGRMMANKGQEFGVDVSQMLWAEDERAGLYFVEYGASPRPTRVVYDRKDSALAKIQPGMVNWEYILRGVRLFHVGGITPAISPSAAKVQVEALRAARKVGCLVSYDLNFRAMLWTLEEAQAAQLPLMEYVDILVTSLPDQPDVKELISGMSGENPADVAKRLSERFGFKAVLVTMRSMPTVTLTNWTSLAYANGDLFTDRVYEIEAVDRLGGGDACVAGFLTGYLEGDPGFGVRLGNAFSALKQTSPTDWPWPTRQEAEDLIAAGETRMAR